MSTESGAREIDLREKCLRCKGKGGWVAAPIYIFEVCDTCDGEGRLPYNLSKKQKEHQQLWAERKFK